LINAILIKSVYFIIAEEVYMKSLFLFKIKKLNLALLF